MSYLVVEITATNGVKFHCWADFHPEFAKAKKQGELGTSAKPGSNLGSGERWISRFIRTDVTM